LRICLACVCQYAFWCERGKSGTQANNGLHWGPGSGTDPANDWVGGDSSVLRRQSLEYFPGTNILNTNNFYPNWGTYWRVANRAALPVPGPGVIPTAIPNCVCGETTATPQGDHSIKQKAPDAGLGAVRSCAVCTVFSDPHIWSYPLLPRAIPWRNEPGDRGWVYKRRDGREMRGRKG
jgi:hypothetical protein